MGKKVREKVERQRERKWRDRERERKRERESERKSERQAEINRRRDKGVHERERGLCVRERECTTQRLQKY